MSDRRERVRLIYDEAVSLAANAREQYVRSACGDDAELMAEVRSLLSRMPETGELPVTPLLDDTREDDPVPQVPGYRVTRRLGSGGMGVVWEALQLSTQRPVALKTVRSLDDHDELRSRLLEREIETLARLEHPGIATIYEAVRTESGTLCFAMELVDGVPLDEYVAPLGRQRPAARLQVLRLFAQLCDTVHYAHQRGVIHRDLKPSNILVTEGDGEVPVAKVLDFGVARLLNDDEARTRLTEVGGIRGTLQYMSPEQASADDGAIDVRSDVYSLGVILYELLTGTSPYDLKNLSLVSALTKICEHPPTPPTQIDGTVDTDLQVIALTALAKAPNERYQSANALAEDVRRFLSSQPIHARPPSAWYLFKKLVRRHRLPFALAAGFVALMVTAAVAMTVLYVQAERNLERANLAEATAQRETRVAQRVSSFLTELFEVSDPSQARGETVTARELLDAGAERINDELADEPMIRASMMQTMGSVYRSLGLFASAEPLMTSALETYESQESTEPKLMLPVLKGLAGLRHDQGRYAEAEQIARRLVEFIRTEFGEDHEDMGDALGLLSGTLTLQGRFDEAEPYALRGVALNEARFGANDPRTAQALRMLGPLYTAMQRYDDAARVIDREIALRRSLPEDELGLAGALHERAEVHLRQREYEQAEKRYLQVVEIQERVLGPDHPTLAFEYNNMGILYRRMQRPDDAERAYRRAIAIREATLAPDHPMLAWTLDNLGLLLVYEDRLEEAEELILRARDIAAKAVGTNHPDYGIVLNNLARLRERQGRIDDAEDLQRRQVEIMREHYEPTTFDLGMRLTMLARILGEQGKFQEAIYTQEEALGIFQHHDAEEDVAKAEQYLAQWRDALGRE